MTVFDSQGPEADAIIRAAMDLVGKVGTLTQATI